MGSRRRSYIVLGLVLALIIASVYAVTSKPTRQGIDLAGGTELVYEARATGANTTINVEDVDRSVDLIRERVDALGVAEPEITRIGENQISVSLPRSRTRRTRSTRWGRPPSSRSTTSSRT